MNKNPTEYTKENIHTHTHTHTKCIKLSGHLIIKFILSKSIYIKPATTILLAFNARLIQFSSINQYTHTYYIQHKRLFLSFASKYKKKEGFLSSTATTTNYRKMNRKCSKKRTTTLFVNIRALPHRLHIHTHTHHIVCIKTLKNLIYESKLKEIFFSYLA